MAQNIDFDTIDPRPFSERLALAVEEAKSSAQTIADHFNISPQAVYQWLKGTTRPGNRRIVALATLLDVSARWLSDGRGAMYDEMDGKQVVVVRRVPIIDKVKAGHWEAVTDPYSVGDAEDWIVPDSDTIGPHCFALRVDGRSMEPQFGDGDVIIVDPEVEPMPGDFVVAKLDADEAATFKKYRIRALPSGQNQIELKPLNEDWPPLYLDDAHPGHIVGTVIEHRRRLRR